jgi:hypothetical protein
MASSPSDRSETFTANERQAVRQLLEQLAEKLNINDAVDLIVSQGIANTLGCQTRSESGAFRMVRCDPEIHAFLRKIYDPDDTGFQPTEQIIQSPGLFCVSDGETRLYMVASRNDERLIRGSFALSDHGGMPYDLYNKIATKGTITAITSLEQVPLEDHNTLPFVSDEEETADYYDTEKTIKELLS